MTTLIANPLFLFATFRIGKGMQGGNSLMLCDEI